MCGCVDVVIKCTCQLSGKGDDQIWLSTGIPNPVDKKPELIFKIPVVVKCNCQLPGKGNDQIWMSTGIPVLVDKKPEQAEAELKCSAWTCLDFVS